MVTNEMCKSKKCVRHDGARRHPSQKLQRNAKAPKKKEAGEKGVAFLSSYKAILDFF